MWKPFALLLALATPATAQTFDDALTLWTNGDDMAAVEALRDLAQGGDVDAQLFLGQISTDSTYWPAEIAEMPRRDRNRLLRAPGGLSGKSWMDIAAETEPRAAAIRESGRADTRGDAIAALIEMGEPRIAISAWPSFLAQGDVAAALEIAKRRSAPDQISDWGPYLSSIDLNTGTRTVNSPEGWLPLRKLGSSPSESDIRDEGTRVARRAGMTPYVDFCTQSCGAEGRDLCLGAIWFHSTYDPDIALSTPVEGLLSQSDYIQSPRIAADVARTIDAIQFRLDQNAPPRLAEAVQCAWDGVLAAR